MKLSISWIFDHINANWKKQDIDTIITRFNSVTAEIENFYKVKFDLSNFAIAQISEIQNNSVKVYIPEWKMEEVLPKRDDLKKEAFFLVLKKENQIYWAKLNDFHLFKEGYIPAVDVDEKNLTGGWKNNFETEDIIIEIDNKSITHRPDMWGHRGFAREIAAFMNLELIPESKFLEQKEVFNFDKKSKTTKTNPISIEIEDPQACYRFAGIYLDKVENRNCDLFILSRLLKVDVRPIDLLVDISNYLTLDWSQPVHMYDSSKVK